MYIVIRFLVVSESASELTSNIDAIARDLTRSTGRFSKIAGRVPGNSYSPVAWRVLAELEDEGEAGGARVSDLAQRQRVAQPSMTGLLQRLEGESWVTRRPDPADGRATLVSITAAGRSALDEYRRASAARVRPHLAELSDFDRATLARAAELLTELTERIDPSPA